MRRFLCVALAAAGCTAGAPPGTAATASAAPVQLSGSSPFAAGCMVPDVSRGSAVEPDLAVDPGDPQHMAAVWQQDRVLRGAALGNLVATSRDGGRTWRSRPLPHLTRCTGGAWTLASDPWVSIGAGGVVYASSLLITPAAPFRSGLAVSASSDGGDHWGDPVVIQSSVGDQLDKPNVLADPRVRGAAYAVWVTYPRGRDAGRNRVWLARTTDGGRTWSPPHLIRDAGVEDQFNQLLPGPSGSLLLAFVEASELSADPQRTPAALSLETMRSDDHGTIWTQAVAAASFPFAATRDPMGDAVRAFSANFSAAAARDGSLYLAWSSGTAVFVARSADTGMTWVRLKMIEDSTQTFLPTVGVTGDGTVGISWYDFRDYRGGSARRLTDLWFGQSRDAGQTWTTERLDGPFDLRSAPRSDAGAFIGDYEGLVGLPGAFGALYVVGQPRSGRLPTAVFYQTVGTRSSGGPAPDGAASP
jgi:BNR repeat-like domain